MSISQLFSMRCSGYAANDWSIRETKKQTNPQLQFLPGVGSFLPLLPLHPPRPLSSAPAVRTNTPPLTLIGSGRVMWYIVWNNAKGHSY